MEGQEGDSENQSPRQQQESDGLEVHVQLPTGETASFQAKRSWSVRDLKMNVELNSGVPSDLFTLVHNQGDNNTVELKDETKIADIATQVDLGSVTLELSIPPWWQRFVDRCMKRDNRQILKRIEIKMNQISSEQRAFVAAFIAAQKGDGQLFQSLLNNDVKIDIEQTVQCSGRTLLHAAVTGENFACAAALFMNDGSSLLSRADHHGVTPLEMAKNSNHPRLMELFDKYVELEARESSEDDTDVGKSSENNIKESDNSSGDGKTQEDEDGANNLDEESKKNDEVYQNGSKESSIVHDDKNNARMDQMTREEVGQTRETKHDLRKRPSTAHGSSHRMLKRDLNLDLKLHRPLRGTKSLSIHDRPASAKAKLICAEEIRPLSGKVVSGVKQTEERLPIVNTQPSSPMNSPRMGRKLVPSLLNTESPNLRPRSPTCPFPRSPSAPRARSPLATLPGSPSGSPAFSRKVFRVPSLSEPQKTRADTYHGRETGATRTRKMSNEMKHFLMAHYEPRENKPWNVWKTVRKNQTNQFDQSDDDDDDDEDSSSEDENERLSRFLQTSQRRKTFEMWLTDKEAALARKQTLLAEKAKQEATAKKKEETLRHLTGKTHGEWLGEKHEFRAEEAFSGKPGEHSDERKAAALKKYQEWLRSKDEEALARENRLREEAAEKFFETKHKRDEKMQRAWFKNKLLNTP